MENHASVKVVSHVLGRLNLGQRRPCDFIMLVWLHSRGL